MNLVIQVERTGDLVDAELITSVTKAHMEIAAPMSPNERISINLCIQVRPF